MTVYANVGHILLKRGNTVQSTAYKGPLGELTLDTDLHTVRVHDGETFGGNVILASNAEVWALSNSISTITGLDSGFISNINTLLSNAATQATSLTTLTANAAAQATDITNLWSNAATQSSALGKWIFHNNMAYTDGTGGYNPQGLQIWAEQNPPYYQGGSASILLPSANDSRSTPLAINNINGGVSITTGNAFDGENTGTYTWYFEFGGRLHLPPSQGVGPYSAGIIHTVGDDMPIQFQTEHGVLLFNTDGSLEFQDGSKQTTAYTTSVVRAQRTSGGSADTTGKWTFTTISGSVTGEWVANGSIAYPALGLPSNPVIIWTFTGFTKIPSTVVRLGVTGSSLGITTGSPFTSPMSMSATNLTTPNILTSFDPTLHKFYTSESTTLAEDWYFEFCI